VLTEEDVLGPARFDPPDRVSADDGAFALGAFLGASAMLWLLAIVVTGVRILTESPA
jgi:hypothetical protein